MPGTTVRADAVWLRTACQATRTSSIPPPGRFEAWPEACGCPGQQRGAIRRFLFVSRDEHGSLEAAGDLPC